MLRIAIRRSVGAWFFPVVVLLEVLSATQHVETYATTWLGASDTTGAALILLLPLTAGVAAAEALWWYRAGAHEVLEFAAMGSGRVHVTRALALGLWVCAGHTVGVILTWAVTVWQKGEFGPVHVEVVLPGYLAILAAAALGTALGYRIRSLLVPPIIAVCLYLIPAYRLALTSAHFTVGGSTARLIGVEYVPQFLVVQSLWFILIGVAAAVTLWRTAGMGLTLAVWAACVPMAWWLTDVAVERTRPVPEVALVCMDTDVDIPLCAPEELDAELRSMRDALAVPLKRADSLDWSGNSPDMVLTWPVTTSADAVVIVSEPESEYFTDEVTMALLHRMVGCWSEDEFPGPLDLTEVAGFLFGSEPGPADAETVQAAITEFRATCGVGPDE